MGMVMIDLCMGTEHCLQVYICILCDYIVYLHEIMVRKYTSRYIRRAMTTLYIHTVCSHGVALILRSIPFP